MTSVLFISCLLCALLPAVLFILNLRLFRPAPKASQPVSAPAISVLIPARDEELTIEASVLAVLANSNVELECLVLDDHSSDHTASIVQSLALRDPRVRLVLGPSLPSGWCGKQHACFVLSCYARHNVLCFLDADVRLTPDALSRMYAFLEQSKAALVSGFPRQETKTWMEQLLLPLIHFVLLGFLPIARMRQSSSPAYAAACGQLMMVKREAYLLGGGHEKIRASLHDGLQLPRAFRLSGFQTDIFDATDLAVCRMYRNAAEVWNGLTKNATEGMGAPGRILPFTLILLFGQVAPFFLWPVLPAFFALGAVNLFSRVVAASQFRQPVWSAILHPLGILVLLSVQWYALTRKLLGKPAGWKKRAYASLY